MLRVWVDNKPVGILDRHREPGSTFVYDGKASELDAISVTMPTRTASWDTNFGLAPIFEMNLPEGVLRSELNRRFAKVTGTFDNFNLLGIVGRTQVGRLRYSAPDAELDEDVPFQSIDEILRARRGGELFDFLLQKFAVHSGLSGVQPKFMIRAKGEDERLRKSESVRSATHIVKFWNPDEYPELAANEFFCLDVARRTGLRVPNFELSQDGGALVVERFDLKTGGGYFGFEDFCVLNGVGTAKKYEGGYETRLFKRTREFILGSGRRSELAELFKLFALNCAIRNGDAHLKNFGIVYEDVTGAASLAPVYDLVTTTAYIPADKMALTLNGSTSWPIALKLTQLGQTRADLSSKDVKKIFEQIADALNEAAPQLRAYFAERSPEIGEKILASWALGIEDSLGLARNWQPVKLPDAPVA